MEVHLSYKMEVYLSCRVEFCLSYCVVVHLRYLVEVYLSYWVEIYPGSQGGSLLGYMVEFYTSMEIFLCHRVEDYLSDWVAVQLRWKVELFLRHWVTAI